MVNTDPTLVEKCRKVVRGKLKSAGKTWVLFQHQTFVILDEQGLTHETASEKATEIMKKYGPVYAGCEAGDFNLFKDDETQGWIVTGHCPTMFTYVETHDAEAEGGSMMIGLLGRSMRDSDGKNPKIVNVELA